jgi:hypothetical protein
MTVTRRGVGLSAAIVLLWVAARSFGIPELQMAAVGCLVLLVGAVIWAAVLPTRLTADRTVTPGTVWFDHHATVRLTLRNAGRLPTPRLDLHDTAPTSLGASTSTRLAPLSPGSRATVTYALHGGQRGRFTLGPLTIRARDPFGLVSRTRTLDGSASVTVYPPIWTLPAGLPLGGATTSANDGRRRTVASGDDLADIRDYVRGDDLRSVHWPSTAHRGRLMVRRSESTRSPGAVVLLDRRSDRHRGRDAGSSFETAVAAAASTGYHLSARGRSVTLLDGPVARPPRALPWEAWLERLADATTETVDLPGMLRQVGDGVAGDGTLIAILTVPDAGELRALVRAGRGFTTRAAVIVDAASHGAGGHDPDATAVVASLRAAGWRATTMARGDRLDERWRELVVGRRARTAAVTGTGGR